MTPKLYIYGSENPRHNQKAHLCTDDGNLLCGYKSRWGECTAVVQSVATYGTGYDLFVISFGCGSREVPEVSMAWKYSACKICSKRLRGMVGGGVT